MWGAILLAVIAALWFGASFLGWRSGEKLARSKMADIIMLNKGHQVWCQAGPEKSFCTCQTMPSFLTGKDIEERYKMIRWAAMGIKRTESGV